MIFDQPQVQKEIQTNTGTNHAQSWNLSQPSQPAVEEFFFLMAYCFQKRKQNFMDFLSYLRTFCVISFSDGVNLGTYYENLRSYCVRFCTNDKINSTVWKTRAFHWFNPISNHLGTFVANWQLSQNMRFLRNFWPQKLWSGNFFWQISSLTMPYTNTNANSNLVVNQQFSF